MHSSEVYVFGLAYDVVLNIQKVIYVFLHDIDNAEFIHKFW